MTTVQTRVREVSDREGFDIVVTKDGIAVDTRANGLLGRYPFERASKGAMTVNDWRGRFEGTYRGYSCAILNGDGTTAVGQTSLRSVRETYEEE